MGTGRIHGENRQPKFRSSEGVVGSSRFVRIWRVDWHWVRRSWMVTGEIRGKNWERDGNVWLSCDRCVDQLEAFPLGRLAWNEDREKVGRSFISNSLLNSCNCHLVCRCIWTWEHKKSFGPSGFERYLEEGCGIVYVFLAALSTFLFSGNITIKFTF